MINPLIDIIGAAGLVIGSGITIGAVKATKEKPVPCPTCPSLTCPPSTMIKFQDTQFDALKKVKGNIDVHNEMTGSFVIMVAKEDSAAFARILNSVNKNQ